MLLIILFLVCCVCLLIYFVCKHDLTQDLLIGGYSDVPWKCIQLKVFPGLSEENSEENSEEKKCDQNGTKHKCRY